MKKLFVLANVVAALLALLAAFNILFATSLSVDHMTRAIIALAIGLTCVWIARQSVARSSTMLR